MQHMAKNRFTQPASILWDLVVSATTGAYPDLRNP